MIIAKFVRYFNYRTELKINNIYNIERNNKNVKA